MYVKRNVLILILIAASFLSSLAPVLASAHKPRPPDVVSCGKVFGPAPASKSVHHIELVDYGKSDAIELKRQLSEQEARLAALGRLNQDEYDSRMFFMKELLLGRNLVPYGEAYRTLNAIVIRISQVSEINNTYLSISHMEELLELSTINLKRKLATFHWSKIVLHRWSGFYIFSPLTEAEFVVEVLNPLKMELIKYLEAQRPSSEIRRQHSEFQSWKVFVDKALTLDVMPLDPERIPNYRDLSAPALFQKIVLDAHLVSAFRQVKYQEFNLQTYEAWRVQAAARARSVAEVLAKKRIPISDVMTMLHRHFKDGQEYVFYNWLRGQMGGDRRFGSLIDDLRRLMQDFKVSAFLQYSEDQRLKREKGLWSPEVPFSNGMNMFVDRLPESSVERRRLLLNHAMKEGGYIIATDLQGLGITAKMEMFKWFLSGAEKTQIPRIFDRLNAHLAEHFRSLENKLRKITGKSVSIYVAGDDAFFVLPEVSPEVAAQAASLIADSPMNLKKLYPNDPGIKEALVYSSGAVRIPPDIERSSAVGVAMAKARYLLNEFKRAAKDVLFLNVGS